MSRCLKAAQRRRVKPARGIFVDDSSVSFVGCKFAQSTGWQAPRLLNDFETRYAELLRLARERLLRKR